MKYFIFLITALFFCTLIARDYKKNGELRLKDMAIIIGGALFYAWLIWS